jgi:hypothetical protein
MKNKVYKALLLTLIVLMPVSAMADVRVHVNIPLPLPIVFPSPPHLVVIPDTDVYAVADIGEDIFFHAGWWWRPWNNRWYRSRYYDRDWAYHPYQPSFQRYVPADGDGITGIKRGMDIAGNPSGGHIRTSNAIGMSGRKTGTGINKAMELKK